MKSLVFSALALTIAGIANARNLQYYSGPLTDDEPEMYCQIDSQGNQIGPWIKVEPSTNREVQLFTKAYDGVHMTDDGATFNNLIYNPSVPAGSFLSADTNGNLLREPIMVNDMDCVTGSEGKSAQRFILVNMWSPAGGTFISNVLTQNPNAGAYRAAIDVWTVGRVTDANDVNFPYTDIGNGYRFVFGAAATGRAPGFYRSTMNLTELGGQTWSVPPAADGGVLVIVRKVDPAGVVSSLTGVEVAHVGVRPLATADDAFYPGTNPSQSNTQAWIDLSGGYGFSTNEYVDYTNSATLGKLQPAAGFWWDTDKAHQSIALTVEDVSYPRAMNVVLTAVDGSGNPLLYTNNSNAALNGQIMSRETIVFVNSVGKIQITNPFLDQDGTNPLPAENKYIMSVKRTHWLRANTGVIDFSILPLTEVNLTLLNGDVDGNNEVGPADFATLSAAFGTEIGNTGYVAGADLNEDGEVGPGDFAILANNFGLEGDALPGS